MDYITIKKAIRHEDKTIKIYTSCDKNISLNDKYGSKDYEKLFYTYMSGGKEYKDVIQLDYDYIGKYNRQSNMWKIMSSVKNGYCIINNNMVKTFEQELNNINKNIQNEIKEIELKRTEIVAKEDEDRIIADKFIERINNHNDEIMDIVQQDIQFNHDDIEKLIGTLLTIDDERVKQAFREYIR